jgi:hypothetical protein
VEGTRNSGKDDPVMGQALRGGELHKAPLDHLEAGIYRVENNLGLLDFLTRWDQAAFRIEVHSCWGLGLGELTRKLQVLVRASNLKWWGHPVRVRVSIASAMAEPGESEESLETHVAAALANSRTARSSHDREDAPSNDFVELGDERCLP